MIVYFQIDDRLFSAKLTTIIPPPIPRVPFYFQSKDRILSPQSYSLCLIKCFKSPKIVSNVFFLYPTYFLCFHYTDFVSNPRFCFQCSIYLSNIIYIFSKLNLCFQIAMLPMYVSNKHRAVFPSGYGLGEV